MQNESQNYIVLIWRNGSLYYRKKRGFDMVRLFHNVLDISRKLKPKIPLIGENSIPLRHEIEVELLL